MAAYGPRHTAIVIVVAMVGLAGILDAHLAAAPDASGDALIQRVIAQTSRVGVARQAIRDMRAGTRSGKHQGWMKVETELDPSEGLTWTVVDEGGSERTRNKVLRELLRNEAASWHDGTREAAALTPANYEFHSLTLSNGGAATFRLVPRRPDPKLIDGVLTVSTDGYPLRFEGTLAKSPSFWVKSVTVVQRYDRFAGVALPTSIESLADVKIVGQASFSMRYRYTEVEGRRVTGTMASALTFSPSAELLALHAANARR